MVGPAQAVVSDEVSARSVDAPLCDRPGAKIRAGLVIPAGDRKALERVVRDLLRPPLSSKRLSRREGGTVVYRLPRADRWGRTVLVMSPLEFLSRLTAILPPPRLALRRQRGLFA